MIDIYNYWYDLLREYAKVRCFLVADAWIPYTPASSGALVCMQSGSIDGQWTVLNE